MRSIGREERSRPTDGCDTYLLRLYDALRPRHESFVWSGWVLAITLLGLETLSDVVRRAFGRSPIDAVLMGCEPFREDLGRTLADPERMAGFRHDRIGPLEDAVGELSGWYAFSDQAKRDRARRSQVTAFDPPPRGPAFNPYKHVDRDGPCPCGSGKRFEKCCLPRVSTP